VNYDNNLSGALFKNDEKRDGKQDPDYRGQCEIEGTEYWVSAWINESKKGAMYLSLKFNAKQAKRGAPQQPKAASTESFNDFIPF
jgi:uncharacterized protein (DUF736 family)